MMISYDHKSLKWHIYNEVGTQLIAVYETIEQARAFVDGYCYLRKELTVQYPQNQEPADE